MLALALAALFAVAAVAYAEGTPTREEYVAQVDPICKQNTDTNKPLLDQARKLGKKKQYAAAAGKVSRVAANFARTIKSIEAVPRPEADSARLEKWFKYLRITETNLTKVVKALKHGNRVRATHEEIRVERSSNAANNVSSVFGFKYCHLSS